jgi:hypothetical protein
MDFGVPSSHSFPFSSVRSCGSRVTSSFFFVSSRYFDDTYIHHQLNSFLAILPRNTGNALLTWVLYVLTSSGVPPTLTKLSSMLKSAVSHKASRSIQNAVNHNRRGSHENYLFPRYIDQRPFYFLTYSTKMVARMGPIWYLSEVTKVLIWANLISTDALTDSLTNISAPTTSVPRPLNHVGLASIDSRH